MKIVFEKRDATMESVGGEWTVEWRHGGGLAVGGLVDGEKGARAKSKERETESRERSR